MLAMVLIPAVAVGKEGINTGAWTCCTLLSSEHNQNILVMTTFNDLLHCVCICMQCKGFGGSLENPSMHQTEVSAKLSLPLHDNYV